MTEDDNVVPVEELNRRRRVNQLADDVVDLWRDLGERTGELRDLGVPPAEWLELAFARLKPRTAERLAGSEPMLATFITMIQRFADRDGPDTEPLSKEEINAAISGASWMAGSPEFSIGEMWTMVRSYLPVVFPKLAAMFAGDPGPRPEPLSQDEYDAMRHDEALNACTPAGYRMRKLIDRLFAEAPKLEGAEGQAPALECAVLLRGANVGMQGALSKTPEGTLRMLVMQKDKGGQLMAIEHFFDYDELADVALVRPVTTETGPRIHTA